jgi:hypothetical protein
MIGLFCFLAGVPTRTLLVVWVKLENDDERVVPNSKGRREERFGLLILSASKNWKVVGAINGSL